MHETVLLPKINLMYKKIHMQSQSKQCLTDMKSHIDMMCVVISRKPHSLRLIGKCEVFISSHSLQAITCYFREIIVAIPIPIAFLWDPLEFPVQAYL